MEVSKHCIRRSNLLEHGWKSISQEVKKSRSQEVKKSRSQEVKKWVGGVEHTRVKSMGEEQGSEERRKNKMHFCSSSILTKKYE